MENILLKEDIELLITDIECQIIDIKEWLTTTYTTLSTKTFNEQKIKSYKRILNYLKTLMDLNI